MTIHPITILVLGAICRIRPGTRITASNEPRRDYLMATSGSRHLVWVPEETMEPVPFRRD